MATPEIVLIGLGEFGRTVVSTFSGLLQDRAARMRPSDRDRAVVHCLEFSCQGPFSFKEVAGRITAELEDARARKFSEAFSYVIIGDLGEEGTARYALDFGFLPWVLDQAKTLPRKEVLGFFTFSDELGVSDEKHSSQGMALIRSFFVSLQNLAQKKQYEVPYKDVQGRSFSPIAAPQGPFLRNYVVVTPGKKKAVLGETSRVFAERLFYDVFYLGAKQSELARGGGVGPSDSEVLFSTFSLLEVSRPRQLQEYHLKYELQSRIIQYLLAESLPGTDWDHYEDRFFELIELPSAENGFPLDRAVELFYQQNLSSFEHLLHLQVGTESGAFHDYLSDCRRRIDAAVQALVPKFDRFVRDELDYLLVTLDHGLKSLFQINRLLGNLAIYISYMDKIEARFSGWSASLEAVSDEPTPEVDALEAGYQAVEQKIQKTLRNKVLNFPLFRPVRVVAIQNHILGIPFEDYISMQIRRRLAQSFAVLWKDTSADSRHPLRLVQKVRADLEVLRSRLQERLDQVTEKRRYIERISAFYYVVTPLGTREHLEILGRNVERNFGPGKKTELEQTAVRAFQTWTEGKDLVGITANPTAFLAHVEEYALASSSRFSDLDRENDTDTMAAFAQRVSGELGKQMSSLVEKSFKLGGGSIGQTLFALKPELSSPDSLEKALELDGHVVGCPVPQDFTLGATVFIQDNLKLKYSSFQKYDFLEREADVTLDPPVYADNLNVQGPVTDDQLTLVAKHIRAILLDLCPESDRLRLFKDLWGEERTTLSADDVNRLAASLDLERALELLDENQIRNYARSRDIPINPSREKMVRLIVKRITDKVV